MWATPSPSRNRSVAICRSPTSAAACTKSQSASSSSCILRLSGTPPIGIRETGRAAPPGKLGDGDEARVVQLLGQRPEIVLAGVGLQVGENVQYPGMRHAEPRAAKVNEGLTQP